MSPYLCRETKVAVEQLVGKVAQREESNINRAELHSSIPRGASKLCHLEVAAGAVPASTVVPPHGNDLNHHFCTWRREGSLASWRSL